MEAIICIIERGKADAVVKEAVKAGATGATIFYGRGGGEQTFSFFHSLNVAPSKEVIIILAEDAEVDNIFNAVAEAAKVQEKGKGIVFTLPVGRISRAE